MIVHESYGYGSIDRLVLTAKERIGLNTVQAYINSDHLIRQRKSILLICH